MWEGGRAGGVQGSLSLWGTRFCGNAGIASLARVDRVVPIAGLQLPTLSTLPASPTSPALPTPALSVLPTRLGAIPHLPPLLPTPHPQSRRPGGPRGKDSHRAGHGLSAQREASFRVMGAAKTQRAEGKRKKVAGCPWARCLEIVIPVQQHQHTSSQLHRTISPETIHPSAASSSSARVSCLFSRLSPAPPVPGCSSRRHPQQPCPSTT